jgi:DNA-binding CsgD family transcriptional regulator
MPSTDLELGRTAFDRRAWRDAFQHLRHADAAGALGAEDLRRLGMAAHLVGEDEVFVSALERAHRLYLEEGDCAAAVRAGFWLGTFLANRGEMAQASGWSGRIGRLLEQTGEECVERGYLLLTEGQRALMTGDSATAHARGAEAARLAQRHGDADLLTLGIHLQGRALLLEGQIEEGLALLDEAMLAVGTDDLSPQVTGLVYCSVIGACRSVFALGRARQWTSALTVWCDRQPDMVAYTGECLVYRAELLQLRGAWREALEEARRAAQRAGSGGGAAAGLALYQQGEALRELGELGEAEDAYRAASRLGREPMPGLALLRLTQGDLTAAAGAICRALAEVRDPLRRGRLLPAHVEIILATGDLDAASTSANELQMLATQLASPVLEAAAAHARGAVALARGENADALSLLRRAWGLWLELEAPASAARSRLLLGYACRALGDEATASLEIEAARAELARFGSLGDEVASGQAGRRAGAGPAHGRDLTARELSVLSLVATGMTNRAIAEKLFISEKTVARHVSNIFRKLDVTSRAGATAYAYTHRLVPPSA